MSWVEKMPELMNSVQKIYTFCKVQPSERVVIVTDTQKDKRLVDAFTLVGHALGARPTLLCIPTQPGPGNLPLPVESFMLENDVVFDLMSKSWMYSDTLKHVLDANVRVLQVLTTAESLIARPPDLAAAERVRKGTHILGKSNVVRITSDLGTDLTVPRGGRPALGQKGFVDEPGSWDSCALKMVNIYPLEGLAEGRIVLTGTLTFVGNAFIVEEPIGMTVEQGRITSIERKTEVGRRLDDWLKKFNNPNSYAVSHIGFGTDHRADLSIRDGAAFESYLGGVVLGFGSNIVPKYGGVNRAPSHFDAVLHGGTFTVDELQVIKNGKFTKESGLAD